MIIARTATTSAKSVLRQATARFPKRLKISDGLLPSLAHQKQNPSSDHNTGYAVDITHDPAFGIDCAVAFKEMQKDKRVKYLIFKGKIWSQENSTHIYTGSNPHNKHLHISIKDNCGNDDSDWFPWLPKPKTINKVKSKLPKRLPKKKENK